MAAANTFKPKRGIQTAQSVMDFNEGAFERAAQSAQAQCGDAKPENLNRMLQSSGFREE